MQILHPPMQILHPLRFAILNHFFRLNQVITIAGLPLFIVPVGDCDKPHTVQGVYVILHGPLGAFAGFRYRSVGPVGKVYQDQLAERVVRAGVHGRPGVVN